MTAKALYEVSLSHFLTFDRTTHGTGVVEGVGGKQINLFFIVLIVSD